MPIKIEDANFKEECIVRYSAVNSGFDFDLKIVNVEFLSSYKIGRINEI